MTVGSTMADAADEADMAFWKGAAQPAQPSFPMELSCSQARNIRCPFMSARPKPHVSKKSKCLFTHDEGIQEPGKQMTARDELRPGPQTHSCDGLKFFAPSIGHAPEHLRPSSLQTWHAACQFQSSSMEHVIIVNLEGHFAGSSCS